MNKRHFLLFLLCIVMCMVFFGCGSNNNNYFETTEICDDANDETELEEQCSSDKDKSSEIYVYICGEVINPGVYILSEGSRVCDVIEASGGFTDNAGDSYWNLAESLTDGQMIYVPTRQEAEERRLDSNEALRQEQLQDDKIDINTASVSEFTSLSGIGQSKAEAIVEYRNTNGRFSTVEELTNVAGIGESTLNKIRNQIKV